MAYDITVIRPEMREEQIRPRGRDLGKEKRKALKRGLQTLHSLEIMAVNIYKCQITKDVTPLNTALAMSMSNEMTHMQDFQTRLVRVRLQAGQAARAASGWRATCSAWAPG